MSEYEQICYPHTYINQVIIRLDFLNYCSSEVLFTEDFEKEIKKYFPRKNKDQLLRFNSFNVMFDPNNNGMPNANGTTIEGLQKEYSTADGKNKLFLSNKFIALEVNAYVSFEEHLKCLRSCVLSLFSGRRITVARTGIRYINIYDQEKIKLQKSFFSDDIAASLVVKKTIQDAEYPYLIRSMHTSEYRSDSLVLNFRYGMFNPEYPNIMTKNSFVLDYDCFSEEIIETSDLVIETITQGHSLIQSLFEKNITDSMRKVMKNGL